MAEALTRAPGLDVNEVPDGYIIYQVAADRVHYLNNTAAIVFELCDGAKDRGDVVSRMKKISEGASDTEVEACIDALLKEGLIQRSE
jgi:hypothetical protein